MRTKFQRELVLWSSAYCLSAGARRLTSLALVCVAWMVAGTAHAGVGGGGGLPFDDAAGDLFESFTGPLAAVCGVGGVVATGSAWMNGASMDTVVSRGVGTVAGVSLLGGAGTLYDSYDHGGAIWP